MRSWLGTVALLCRDLLAFVLVLVFDKGVNTARHISELISKLSKFCTARAVGICMVDPHKEKTAGNKSKYIKWFPHGEILQGFCLQSLLGVLPECPLVVESTDTH